MTIPRVVASSQITGNEEGSRLARTVNEIADNVEISKHYWTHINADTVLVGETTVPDLSLSGNPFSAGVNLSSAQMLATDRMISTVNPVAGSTDSVLRSPPLGFDYENGESILLFFKGMITPEGSNQVFMGDTFSSSTEGLAFRVRPTGAVDFLIGSSAGALFSGATTGVFSDTEVHSFALLLNGVDRTYKWYFDGEPETDEITLGGGAIRDSVSSQTFNLGSGSPAPGGTAGVVTKVNTLAVLRSSSQFKVEQVNKVVQELHMDGRRLVRDTL